jgi:hypothetical protein
MATGGLSTRVSARAGKPGTMRSMVGGTPLAINELIDHLVGPTIRL